MLAVISTRRDQQHGSPALVPPQVRGAAGSLRGGWDWGSSSTAHAGEGENERDEEEEERKETEALMGCTCVMETGRTS